MAEHWHSIGEWDQPLIYTSIEAEFSRSQWSALLTPKIPGAFRVDRREFFFERRALLYLRRLVRTTPFLDRFIRIHRRGMVQFKQTMLAYAPPRIRTHEGAEELLQLFVDTNRDFVYFFDVGILLDPILHTLFPRSLNFEDIAALVQPTITTDIVRETQALSKITRAIVRQYGEHILASPTRVLTRLRGTALLGALRRHAARYSYLPMQTLRGQPWTLRDYCERMPMVLQRHTTHAHRPRVMLDRKTRVLIVRIRTLNALRMERIEYLNRWAWLLMPLWRYCMRALQCTWTQLLSCTYEEILSGLRNGRLGVDHQELDRRNIAYAFLWRGRIKTCRAASLRKKKVLRVTVIRGMTAQPGRVEGRICVVRGADDFPQFRKGDVLVASHTTPNYMAIIVKAAAIITDLGGITAHAAVIARELKIPCIIGTKIATRSFCTGDRVVVDAERGIVRRIS